MKNGKHRSSIGMLEAHVPEDLRNLKDPARELPRLAKNPSAMAKIESAMSRSPRSTRCFWVTLGTPAFPPGRSTWF